MATKKDKDKWPSINDPQPKSTPVKYYPDLNKGKGGYAPVRQAKANKKKNRKYAA